MKRGQLLISFSKNNPTFRRGTSYHTFSFFLNKIQWNTSYGRLGFVFYFFFGFICAIPMRHKEAARINFSLEFFVGIYYEGIISPKIFWQLILAESYFQFHQKPQFLLFSNRVSLIPRYHFLNLLDPLPV